MADILLLHGALGSKEQMTPLAELLDGKVRAFNFSSHGGEPIRPISILLLAEEISRYMDTQGIESAHIFGYSMGGYAAMYLASQQPARVASVITLATKFAWDATIAAKELKLLNPEKIREKLPAFAAELEKRHLPNDWTQVVESVKELMAGLGEQNALEDYSSTATKTLLLLGDRDKMVSIEETLAVYRQLPNAQLGILPNTPHPFEQVDCQYLSQIIRRFISNA